MSVSGGYQGTVVEVHSRGVTIELGTAARLEVSWGARVQKGTESGPLGGELSESAPGGDGLADRLRAWRLEKSRELGVPAYVIFSDRTLDDLVARRPTDETALLAIHGIGPAKLESFGDDLLEVVGGGERSA